MWTTRAPDLSQPRKLDGPCMVDFSRVDDSNRPTGPKTGKPPGAVPIYTRPSFTTERPSGGEGASAQPPSPSLERAFAQAQTGDGAPGEPEVPYPYSDLPYCPEWIYGQPPVWVDDVPVWPTRAPNLSQPRKLDGPCKVDHSRVVNRPTGPKIGKPAGAVPIYTRPSSNNAKPSGGEGGPGEPSSSDPRFSWAINFMLCDQSPCTSAATGITNIYGNLSQRFPELEGRGAWWGYHYYNRIQLVHPAFSIVCDGEIFPEFISVGIATGDFGTGVLYANEIIVENFSTDLSGVPTCETESQGIFLADPSAITFQIERIGDTWFIKAWLGGEWQLLSFVTNHWNVSAQPEYGQELRAENEDQEKILAPLNFAHKFDIRGDGNPLSGPWHENYLASPLSGRSYSRTDSPFSVTDLAYNNFTSRASCVPFGVPVPNDCP